MRYLSVHDLVWINSTLTGREAAFDYERLEACMAAQYGYGHSRDVLSQAANFLTTFCYKRPFAEKNAETALTAFCTFLLANGWGVTAADAELAGLVQRAWSGEELTAESVRRIAAPDASGGAGLRALVSRVIGERSKALGMLAAEREGTHA